MLILCRIIVVQGWASGWIIDYIVRNFSLWTHPVKSLLSCVEGSFMCMVGDIRLNRKQAVSSRRVQLFSFQRVNYNTFYMAEIWTERFIIEAACKLSNSECKINWTNSGCQVLIMEKYVCLCTLHSQSFRRSSEIVSYCLGCASECKSTFSVAHSEHNWKIKEPKTSVMFIQID